jgi:stearoyl-CoA desaturase (delta-9 desaturase)
MTTETKPLSLNLVNVIFLSAMPILGVIGATWWVATEQFNWATIIFTFIYLNLAGISITAGYHRLFSHRSYDAAKPVEWTFIALGSACFEGSVVDWSTDHRVHHRYQDKAQDPYAIYKGFWFAHIGWLYTKNWRADGSAVPDLWKNPVIRSQHHYFVLWSVAMGFIVPMLVCSLWSDFWGGLLVGGFLRVGLNQQFTFLINSLCHFAGTKPFSDKITARDNWLTAIFTYGEGYHNFHHAFPGDYRNGIRWFDMDITKWLIYALSKVGLAWRLHQVNPERILHSRVLMQEKVFREKLHRGKIETVVLEHINQTIDAAKLQIERASEKLRSVREQYEKLKAEQNDAIAETALEMRAKFLEAQRELRQSYLMWKAILNGCAKLTNS